MRDAQSSNEDQIPVQSVRRAGVMPFHLLKSCSEHFYTIRPLELGIAKNRRLIRTAVFMNVSRHLARCPDRACRAIANLPRVMESQDNRVKGVAALEDVFRFRPRLDHPPSRCGAGWELASATRCDMATIRGRMRRARPGPNPAGRYKFRHWKTAGDPYRLCARTKALTKRPPAASKRP